MSNALIVIVIPLVPLALRENADCGSAALISPGNAEESKMLVLAPWLPVRKTAKGIGHGSIAGKPLLSR